MNTIIWEQIIIDFSFPLLDFSTGSENVELHTVSSVLRVLGRHSKGKEKKGKEKKGKERKGKERKSYKE